MKQYRILHCFVMFWTKDMIRCCVGFYLSWYKTSASVPEIYFEVCIFCRFLPALVTAVNIHLDLSTQVGFWIFTFAICKNPDSLENTLHLLEYYFILDHWPMSEWGNPGEYIAPPWWHPYRGWPCRVVTAHEAEHVILVACIETIALVACVEPS